MAVLINGREMTDQWHEYAVRYVDDGTEYVIPCDDEQDARNMRKMLGGEVVDCLVMSSEYRRVARKPKRKVKAKGAK